MRLKRNSTLNEDFLKQSEILKNRFIVKGYKSTDLELDIQKVSQIDRFSLLSDSQRRVSSDYAKWSFFTEFSLQHKSIKNIIRKHWEILRNDRIL